MRSTINKIYYGEIRPCEDPAPETERSIANKKIINGTKEKLHKMFPDCKNLLDTYTDALHIEAQLESEADFERGFKLGIMLIIDIISTKD